uniref:Acyl carrier protein/phosphopantetheine-binding protein n=1 Tax=Rathayibacter sp. FH 236 TaxID=2615183 RepID=A0A5J6SGE0_9MICO|nr:acyl carrier protein/phosphopantetheine-binding protein [Rathayibacter sp. FH 236]
MSEPTENDILATLIGRAREIVSKEFVVNFDSIGPRSLLADLRLDSMEQVELLSDLEDAFSISLPNEGVRGIRTVGDVIDIVRRGLGQPVQVSDVSEDG